MFVTVSVQSCFFGSFFELTKLQQISAKILSSAGKMSAMNDITVADFRSQWRSR